MGDTMPTGMTQSDTHKQPALGAAPDTMSGQMFRPLPYGVADYFWDEAAQRKELEFEFYDLFQRWGYSLVIPPTFEYAETFYARADSDFQTEMYRFPDKDGTLLSLRPEMTIPVARLAATRLHDSLLPQRYCYMGSVFRYTEPRAGRQREFYQAGVELIGAPTAEADAEVVAVIAAAVDCARIADYQLVLGQLEFFHGLLHDLALAPHQTELLRRAIDRNSEPQLFEFLTATPLRTQQRRTLEALPGLRGADPFAVISHAERFSLNHRMYRALATLRDICRVLEGYRLLDRIYVDLTEINNLGYYTGLSFEVLAPQIGFPVGGGGRYDNLLASFGNDQPAVGAALGLDRLLHARHIQQSTTTRSKAILPQIMVDTGSDPTCLPFIGKWRELGLRVAVQFSGSDTSAGQASQQIPCSIAWRDGSFHVTWRSTPVSPSALAAPAGDISAQPSRTEQYTPDNHAELVEALQHHFQLN